MRKQTSGTLTGSTIEMSESKGSFMIGAYTKRGETSWSTLSGSVGGCAAPNPASSGTTVGALLQSANPRLSRGRIRDRNYEILYLVFHKYGRVFASALLREWRVSNPLSLESKLKTKSTGETPALQKISAHTRSVISRKS
jgi:hypothetical protein